MAYLVNLTGQERSDAKRKIRHSNSGRKLKTPAHLLTSEDDVSFHKK